MDRTVASPAEFPYFDVWDGEFSPDGATFAVPGRSTPSDAVDACTELGGR